MQLCAKLIDVTDSQSPNHLWRLCTAPAEDPWRSRLNLGRLVSNMIIRQAPQRRTKLYFDAWREFVAIKTQQRLMAAARLAVLQGSGMSNIKARNLLLYLDGFLYIFLLFVFLSFDRDLEIDSS